MHTELANQITAALAEFSGETRLFALQVESGGHADLLVEAVASEDALFGTPVYDVIALSTSAHLDIESLMGQPAALEVTLADGVRDVRRGDISAVAMLGSDGGLARYRIRITPWPWRLEHVRNSRVWQDCTVNEIVDAVFSAYTPHARWRRTADASSMLATLPARSFCCQYRESDLDFVRRLLDEEGLGWRTEQTPDGPCLVLFADSTCREAIPDDRSCQGGMGVRYHAAGSVEQEDSVQALVAQMRLHASSTSLQSADYKSGRVIGAVSPCLVPVAGLPPLESYDAPGQYAFTDAAHARHHADLRMEAAEANSQLWQGRSTVRTLRAGTRLKVTGVPLQKNDGAADLTVSRVMSIGLNNLPPPAQLALAELFGPVSELLEQSLQVEPKELALVMEQARKTGYANYFEAHAADLSWRPQADQAVPLSLAKPTAHGAQTAIVIGADGSDHPNGGEELYCDRLGRIRIRFHWQDDRNASCWVRVAQRLAGSGLGSHFLPRIGQEVLVQFLENDIDRPIVVGALYNGRGEGGVSPTPGGQRDAVGDQECFQQARDSTPSAQGNLAGGHSPLWHGASIDQAGHRNASAQWGVRSAGFGGTGHNQLLFDDSDGQGRSQLGSTTSATELALGHLLHAADNHRGSLRGLGLELRSDAYGAARGGSGIMVSSWKLKHGNSARDVAGENAAGANLIRQACTGVSTLHLAATEHRTVGLASHTGAAKANASLLAGGSAPLKAMSDAASTPQSEDHAGQADKALVTVSANSVFGASAGQSLQLANGETASLLSMQDTQLASAGFRLHTGQAIGALAGAVLPEAGLRMIAAKDEISVQAQADILTIQGRDDVRFASANAHIDWAAARRITLSTAGGASLSIDGGNISVQCPGKIAVHANRKSLRGPQQMGYPMPALPRSVCVECLRRALAAGSAFSMVE